MEYKKEIISVIIPVYNTEKYIERCVNSVREQSYEQLEIILVNDGSQDRSGKICDQLAEHDKRIRVIHQKNAGVSTARNAGLALASGAYVTFADSDDCMHPEMIQRLYELLKKYGADISSCTYTMEAAKMMKDEHAEVIVYDKVNGIRELLLCQQLSYSVCCKLFSKYTINNISFNPKIRHHEDLLFCYEAMLKCKKTVHTSETMYLYYVNRESVARSNFNHNKMTAIDAQDRILSDIQNRFPNSELSYTAIQQYLKVNTYMAMQMLADGYRNKNDFKRIRTNIQSRIGQLLRGNLSKGYKLNGFLIAYAPYLAKCRIMRKRS